MTIDATHDIHGPADRGCVRIPHRGRVPEAGACRHNARHVAPGQVRCYTGAHRAWLRAGHRAAGSLALPAVQAVEGKTAFLAVRGQRSRRPGTGSCKMTNAAGVDVARASCRRQSRRWGVGKRWEGPVRCSRLTGLSLSSHSRGSAEVGSVPASRVGSRTLFALE